MDSSKFLFLLILIHLLPPTLSAPYNCPVSFCGSSKIAVRFPFRMIGQQPEICGYHGFNLRCDKQQTMLLKLPNSGEFAVRNIDYRSQVIQVYDPSSSSCSAARLLTLNILDSPFSVSLGRNYTLLSCPVEITMNHFVTVPCLSNSTHSTLATSSEFLAMALNVIPCRMIGSLQGLVPRNQDQEGITSDLNMDISLTWVNPNCKACAAKSGTCGYTNTTMKEIVCYGNTKKGNKEVTTALKIIFMALALPAIAASIAITCCICREHRREAARNVTPNAATVTPETAMIIRDSLVVGLDQSTIESYTKVVLGESKRLPGHDDATCPICLSEYNVKEIVRCIPKCKHCFHAECIDEWLKRKGTCPVCRYSPSPACVTL